MVFGINDLLVKAVYGVSSIPSLVPIPLSTDTLTLQSITWSALDELLQNAPANSDSFIGDFPRLVSSEDTLGILNQGDGVRFDRTYEWMASVSSWVYKISMTFAVALDVTAWTSGAHSVDSVRIIITERDNADNLLSTPLDQTINTLMTDIGAAETKVAIIHLMSNRPFKVNQGNILKFRILFNSTDTLVATSFEGIMPIFYYQTGNLAKMMCESGIMLHICPALDAAFDVLRDASLTEGLDYGGVQKDGTKR